MVYINKTKKSQAVTWEIKIFQTKDYKNYTEIFFKIKFLCMTQMTMNTGENITPMKKLELTSMKTKNNQEKNSFSYLKEGEFLEKSPHPKIQFISNKALRKLSKKELEERVIHLCNNHWMIYKTFNNFIDILLDYANNH